VTYNFDPDRWLDNEQASLEARRARGELTDDEFKRAWDALLDEYERHCDRVNIRADY
jgi:hypothetical protein